MTRVAWLQARTQSLSAAAILAILAIVAAITGIQLSHLYHSTVASCTGNCDLTINHFLAHDSFLQAALNFLLRIAPAVLGVFWGAPLVAREFEAGTFRLAWTQSVSRSRWLLTKLALAGLGVTVAAGLFSLIVTWWFRSIDHLNNQYDVFDARDIVPIGYALFAVMLGAFVGAVARRTLPAMAVTLGGVIFARVATMLWVRPRLLPPVHTVMSLNQAGAIGFEIRNGGDPVLTAKGVVPANAWELSSHLITNSGHQATGSQLAAFVRQYCPDAILPLRPPPGSGVRKGPGGPEAFDACRAQAAKVFHVAVSYQPAGHYWPLQALEFGVFTVLALACAGGCYWWVTRRAV